MKDKIKEEVMKVYDQEASVDEVVDKLLVIFSISKSFYCHDEGERGRCDTQCSWCASNTPEKWRQ